MSGHEVWFEALPGGVGKFVKLAGGDEGVVCSTTKGVKDIRVLKEMGAFHGDGRGGEIGVQK